MKRVVENCNLSRTVDVPATRRHLEGQGEYARTAESWVGRSAKETISVYLIAAGGDAIE